MKMSISKIYLLGVAGLVVAQVTTAQSIIVGRSLPLTGPLKTVAEFKRDGGDAYIHKVNLAGGMNGLKIELVTMDDAYKPENTVANLRKITTEYKPIAFLNLLRLPNESNSIPILDELKVPAVGISSATDALRTKFNSYGFPVRAGFVDEARKLVSHVKVIGVSKIALIYQDVPLGLSLKGKTESALKQANLDSKSFMLDAEAKDIVAVARQVTQLQPQAIFLGLLTPVAVSMIFELKKLSYKGAIYTFSSTDANVVAKLLGKDAVGLAIAQVVPVPNGPRVKIVSEYLEAMKVLGHGVPSPLGLEAYIEAKVLVEGIRRAGRNLTASSLVKALDTLKDHDLGGFYVNYSRTEHVGSIFVEVNVISAKGELIR
jgi:branched-chain amino acid transport system substrate-binding protein